MLKKSLISLIIPCYNEEESIPLFYKEINKLSVKEMNYVKFEFIFVNDGSKDHTLEELKKLVTIDRRVRYSSFSKNYGKEAAMYCGLKQSQGDYVAIIDADLQHPPQLLKAMYVDITENGYDCSGARSAKRQNYSFLRKNLTSLFYKIINKISQTEMVSGATDFRLMSRPMVNCIISMAEHNRYSKGLLSFVGFKTNWINYFDNQRIAGKTKWNIKQLFKYAITGIISFSIKPLTYIIFVGILFLLISLLLVITFMIKVNTISDANYMMLISMIVLFLVSGIEIITTGIISLYLSHIHLEVKQRPLYMIRETNVDINR